MTRRPDEPAPDPPPFSTTRDRRAFLRVAVAGGAVVAFGKLLWTLAEDGETRAARKEKLPDGRPRLPPGQRLLKQLRPMGGVPGDEAPGALRLRVHGEVDTPLVLDFKALLALPRTELRADVHCVTGWSCLDRVWTGVRVAELAARAKVRPTARHVIFEAAHGYTSNVPLDEALRPDVLVAHRLDGEMLPSLHGPPVRAVVPQLYFWKSAKWLTGIRFSAIDEPGYWETRGYHNHGDPWREERYG